MKQDQQIKFGNLSWPLKVAASVAWINLVYSVAIMAVGFAIGSLGAI